MGYKIIVQKLFLLMAAILLNFASLGGSMSVHASETQNYRGTAEIQNSAANDQPCCQGDCVSDQQACRVCCVVAAGPYFFMGPRTSPDERYIIPFSHLSLAYITAIETPPPRNG